jgi:pimeloyl-ACP methyl ester carboxylesterase
VSHAQSQGYATLSIDRLGNGASSHPDPINVVQGPLQVEIIYQLVQSLRSGTIPSITQSYNTVILASHSFGSILARSVATLHPTDGADAYILTAAGPNVVEGFASALGKFNPRAASQVNPPEFSSLPQGYLLIDPPAIRDALYSYTSDFSQGLLDYDELIPHIFAAGEVLTQDPLESAPSNFTGPVLVVTGRYDQITCGTGNFSAGVAVCGEGDIAGMKTFFPVAREFAVYITDRTGHNLDTHFSAGESFGVVAQWLDGVGF